MLPNVILRLYRKLICRDTCRLLWLHILTWAVLVVRTKYGKSAIIVYMAAEVEAEVPATPPETTTPSAGTTPPAGQTEPPTGGAGTENDTD